MKLVFLYTKLYRCANKDRAYFSILFLHENLYKNTLESNFDSKSNLKKLFETGLKSQIIKYCTEKCEIVKINVSLLFPNDLMKINKFEYLYEINLDSYILEIKENTNDYLVFNDHYDFNLFQSYSIEKILVCHLTIYLLDFLKSFELRFIVGNDSNLQALTFELKNYIYYMILKDDFYAVVFKFARNQLEKALNNKTSKKYQYVYEKSIHNIYVEIVYKFLNSTIKNFFNIFCYRLSVSNMFSNLERGYGVSNYNYFKSNISFLNYLLLEPSVYTPHLVSIILNNFNYNNYKIIFYGIFCFRKKS
ncbi:hypothetical protein GVAV_000773 [Gurleya vavrai]